MVGANFILYKLTKIKHVALGMHLILASPLRYPPKLSDISISFLPHFSSTPHPVRQDMRQVPRETPCPQPRVSLSPQLHSWAQASIHRDLSEPRKARWRPWGCSSGERRYWVGRQKKASKSCQRVGNHKIYGLETAQLQGSHWYPTSKRLSHTPISAMREEPSRYLTNNIS